jgi:hypothetical protein
VRNAALSTATVPAIAPPRPAARRGPQHRRFPPRPSFVPPLRRRFKPAHRRAWQMPRSVRL